MRALNVAFWQRSFHKINIQLERLEAWSPVDAVSGAASD